MRPALARQRGVAVITALLLTTLAITIVASLFWQQQVQVRSIENQRLQLQKQWILRGALDWTRLILREDVRYSKAVDHLGEPWAVTLAETRLDQYVENARGDNDVPDAAISGGIVDAQSRFNLTNLSSNGTISQNDVAVFGRLLTNLQLNPALAKAAAETMASTQVRTIATPSGTVPKGNIKSSGPVPTTTTSTSPSTSPNTVTSSTAQSLSISYVDDLLAVPGFTPEILAKLKDYVVVLPRRTTVNVNTASAEVLAATVDTLSLSDAAALVASRDRAWFTKREDFIQRLPNKTLSQTSGAIEVWTNYFLVNGNVRLNRAALEMQALIERSNPLQPPSTKVIWIRED